MRRFGQIGDHLCGRPSRPRQSAQYLDPRPTVGSQDAEYDVVIRGARAYESSHPPGTTLDVAVKGGKIAAIELPGNIQPGAGREEIDAAGLIITPGLIDLHTHIFAGMTTLGLDPDEWCLGRGCTTAVDAGSAGATTVEGFIRYIDGQSVTRCLSFLNVGLHGLAGSKGAYAHTNQIKVAPAVDAIKKYPNSIVGVKVLLTASYANGGVNELQAFKAALDVTAHTGVPLMVHHSSSVVPLNPTKPRLEQHELKNASLGAPYSLRPGDIYTHCFHAFKSTIIDGGSHIKSIDPGNGLFDVVPNPGQEPTLDQFHVSGTVWEAKRRGVLFDVGHGSASFSWTVAEIAAREGFFPDTISTDIHVGSCYGPAYDMPTSMTKMLVLGMPLADIIKASTSVPAKTIGWEAKIGRLEVGLEADIALLDIVDVDIDLEDSQSQMRHCSRRIVCKAVWKAGQRGIITMPDDQPGSFPNLKNIALHRPSWGILVVRDDTPPPPVSAEFQTLVDKRLAEMAERAEEWMRHSPQGDGNPNLPVWLTLPWCEEGIEDEETTIACSSDVSQYVQPPVRQRLLISFKESDPQLEAMRLQASIFAQCC